jgi:hypothetical protein
MWRCNFLYLIVSNDRRLKLSFNQHYDYSYGKDFSILYRGLLWFYLRFNHIIKNNRSVLYDNLQLKRSLPFKLEIQSKGRPDPELSLFEFPFFSLLTPFRKYSKYKLDERVRVIISPRCKHRDLRFVTGSHDYLKINCYKFSFDNIFSVAPEVFI